ncbi:hypothetical protein [Nevskia ramosa]|uniref:hypothetical protein n=1 Tax=Nevskia ramosa TaxID=64002 RepID=UPI003D0DA846
MLVTSIGLSQLKRIGLRACLAQPGVQADRREKPRRRLNLGVGSSKLGGNMAAEKAAWIEISKYPVAVMSIFLALVGAKFILGIPFGSVSEITKDGIKFTQDAKGELASLGAQLNAATKSIEEIKAQLSTKPLSSESKSAIFEASQTVSDQTAQIATVSSSGDSRDTKTSGYIWIGDYNKVSATWQRVKLVSATTNAALVSAPSSVSPGTVFTVSGNMVLRDGLPRNDSTYFQGQKSLGVLPVGTRIKILSAPVGIDREFAVQYWAQVVAQQ